MKSLLEQYTLSRNTIRILLPIVAIALVIVAIVVVIILHKSWWLGLIFLGMAAINAIMCIFMLKYLNKKIKELTGEDALNENSTVDR